MGSKGRSLMEEAGFANTLTLSFQRCGVTYRSKATCCGQSNEHSIQRARI